MQQRHMELSLLSISLKEIPISKWKYNVIGTISGKMFSGTGKISVVLGIEY